MFKKFIFGYTLLFATILIHCIFTVGLYAEEDISVKEYFIKEVTIVKGKRKVFKKNKVFFKSENENSVDLNKKFSFKNEEQSEKNKRKMNKINYLVDKNNVFKTMEKHI